MRSYPTVAVIVARDSLTFPDGYIGPEAYSYYVTRLMDGYPRGRPAVVSDGFGGR